MLQSQRGYDAGKKVVGRKRHVAVDIDGRLLAVKITRADVQDQDGGIPLVKRLVRRCPWIETVVVDGGYNNTFIEAVRGMANRVVEVVKRPDFAKGFVLLPKRWRVEQSLGALTISRRLKTDYESLIHVSAAAMLFDRLLTTRTEECRRLETTLEEAHVSAERLEASRAAAESEAAILNARLARLRYQAVDRAARAVSGFPSWPA